MYQAYWGLAQSPFRGQLDARYFHQGPTQDEALARLHFLVEERRALGLFLGEAGSGKSLLLEVFARELGPIGRQVAHLSLVGASRLDFLWTLCCQFGVEPSLAANPFALCRALTDQLVANRYQQLDTIVLVDDADEADEELLDEIARLVLLNQTHDARLTVVLAARPRHASKLGQRLLELAELRIDLEPWDADDTAAFVKKSLALAGRSTPIFTDTGLRRLQELTGGVPRRIKQLADLALLAGAGANLAQIESETLETVFQELGAVHQPGPLAARW